MRVPVPEAAVVAAGTLGIVGAAYFTATGSPPTGLAVAVAALFAMYVGVNLFGVSDSANRTEVRSPPPEVTSEQEAVTSIPLPEAAVVAAGTLGIVGAAYFTSTGSPPTGLAVAVAALLAMYVGVNLIGVSDSVDGTTGRSPPPKMYGGATLARRTSRFVRWTKRDL